jgi:disulfide bond formation protein DsbB
MLRKVLILTGASLLVSAVILSIMPSPVSAQCGVDPPDSSCITCHEIQAPVYENGKWHGVHARKDCCTNCHGGNCSADEKELAHIGIIPNPLEDIYTNCHACHPDYQQRAALFAAELGITPSSCETPTPVPILPGNPRPPELELPADFTTVPASKPPIGLINLGLLIIVILLFWLGWRERKHLSNTK